ncbi:MAG: GNAT family protein [Clostridiales bacterium]|nr:GNAT family N-acetyltransferase [Clostridiales bacterium]MDU2294019.1 GNAT family protein [Peptococcus niger]MDU7245534.1 GNAT family protein [Clostridiales bacterium]
MLSGRKVLLEKPQIQDADVLQKWYLDKEFRLLYDGYRGNSLDMVMAEIKAGRDITDPHAERLNFLVRAKYNQEPIGVAAIMDIDRQNGHAAIAPGIADESKRLLGYGFDLMVVLCDTVFYDFGFRRVYMRVNDNNQLGLRSALSFGFQAEGQLRDHIFTGARYVDQWVLGLLKDEYEQLSVVKRWKARA